MGLFPLPKIGGGQPQGNRHRSKTFFFAGLVYLKIIIVLSEPRLRASNPCSSHALLGADILPTHQLFSTTTALIGGRV